MSIIMGSARIDERGIASGGAAGDQKQRSTPDYRGEVSFQKFYVHRKGWYVIRPKSAAQANAIASAMVTACNNKNLGYDQANRLGVIRNGVNTRVNTECDCSSLVRACIKAGTGKDPGNFNTANEVAVLKASGLFEGAKAYTPGLTLYTGDILVTKTKGHTGIITSGASRTVTANKPTGGQKSVTDIAREVIQGKWGSGATRRAKITAAGYDYKTVQREVNRLLKK